MAVSRKTCLFVLCFLFFALMLEQALAVSVYERGLQYLKKVKKEQGVIKAFHEAYKECPLLFYVFDKKLRDCR